jgi:hypothetical protein
VRKLRLDFAPVASICAVMPLHPPPGHLDLIARLCLEAGRIMEDTSVELALVLPTNRDDRADRLERVHRAGFDIAALAAAAQALHRHCSTEAD